LFESPCDWEKELRRLGAAGWRVSPVNERFDMATSLPKYLWVPSRLLDNELKRAFGHFNARRIPRLCWHHPGGSDLLRAAGFYADSDPEKEDVRSVEALMLAGHAQCVIVETAADLPSPAEIQLSYLKLRALCLPVMITWRYAAGGWINLSTAKVVIGVLRRGFLSDSSVADEKWLSALEGTRWLDHVRACVRKASEVAALLAERSRSVILQESDDRDLNCLLASLVQILSDPHARTQSGFQSLLQKEWVVAGHPFLQRLNLLRDNDREESPVFLLFLDCVWQLLQQFPASFEFTETYLVALHDSSYIPFFSTFLFNCQWERDRRNQHRASNQIYAPVNGWREPLPLEILQKGGRLVKETGGPYLPTIWDWALRYTTQQRARFRNPAYARGSSRVPHGHSAPLGGGKLEAALSGNGAVYLFAKGSLSPQTHLFPWKNGSLSRKGWRWAQSLESLSEQDRSLRSKPSGWPLQPAGLLPASVGPLIQLWRRCYLRGSQEVQTPCASCCYWVEPPCLCGPPDPALEKVLPAGEPGSSDATVYVGGLDEKVSEPLLWEAFLQAGPVVNTHMPKDRVTGQHQGYGFVEFLSEEDADYAIKIMNMIKLYGKPIRVNKASAHNKNLDVGANIFIGNLDPEIDEKLLYDTFSAFGVILQTPKIMRDPDTGNSKGYAFINFASFDASDAAIEAMNGQYLCNRPITVSYAFKKDSKGERHGSALERLLAAQNPLSQADRPHQLFADAPPPPSVPTPVVTSLGPGVNPPDLVLPLTEERLMKTARIANSHLVFFSLAQHPRFSAVPSSGYNCGSVDPQLPSKPDVTASPQRLMNSPERGSNWFYMNIRILCASSPTL
ncbi:Splicing factor 3B subunit 4, partial [Chelonia mydas]